MCVFMNVRVHACTCVCMHVCMHARVYAYTCVFQYMFMHVSVCACTCMCDNSTVKIAYDVRDLAGGGLQVCICMFA
jgi:hypothetical protein